jgi:hypothetical protein
LGPLDRRYEVQHFPVSPPPPLFSLRVGLRGGHHSIFCLKRCRRDGTLVSIARSQHTIVGGNWTQRPHDEAEFVAISDNGDKRMTVTPDTKKTQEQRRPKKKRSGAVDAYNPVNMASKMTETCVDPSDKDESISDDYNPMNMAGKKADVIKR